MRQHLRIVFLLLAVLAPLQAQTDPGKDSVTIADLIRDEAYNRSRVMDYLSTMCDVYGPRLTWSPEYRRAAEWAMSAMRELGLENVRLDGWTPLGMGWTLRDFTARMTEPLTQPLIAYPKAWSPGFKRTNAEVVYLDVTQPADFEKYKGKLKGKYVLIGGAADVQAHFEPQARRTADSVLLRMANADIPPQGGRGRRRADFPSRLPESPDSLYLIGRRIMPDMDSARIMRIMLERVVGPRKLRFAQDEGVLGVLTPAPGDGGTVFVQQAAIPMDPTATGERLSIFDPKAPAVVPQIALAAEHYNRMLRMIGKGQRLKAEFSLDVAPAKPDSGYNIIGEIPGSDLKDEVVMIGGHYDSWHAGTGATDDGTGSAVCLEAMRILKKLMADGRLAPRRTIRIGLWGGEEQGLIGSREYVAEAFGRPGEDGGVKDKTAAYETFCAYFNNDNGTGRVRGIYAQGNGEAVPVFRAWLRDLADPKAQTVTLQNTGGTDHLSFDRIGLPGFQFIQDPVEYGSRTHHSNMDVYERAQEDDLKQAAAAMALFTYNAAIMDKLFPRKPLAPARTTRVVGSR